jgi:hypothetical protein
MKRTLIFLIESHLDQRDYIRFGIEYLSSRYKVQILDCTHFVYPRLITQLNARIDDSYQYKSILNNRDLAEVNPIGVHGIVIDFLGETVLGNVVRRHVLKNGGLRVVVLAGKLHLTQLPLMNRLKKLLLKGWSFNTIKIVALQVARALDRGLKPVRPVDLLVHGGGSNRDVIRAKSVKYAHSFDYDRWRSLLPCGLTDNYALFLDEDIAYHPDYARFGVKPPVKESTYYSAINRFFSEYERYTGIPVYVAVHPRAQYSKRPYLWGNRKLLHGQTPEAVNGASQIFVHFSTAISFAILANKPITHLISNELVKSYLGHQIIGISQFLNTPLVNIDCELHKDCGLNLNQIDNTRYQIYRNMYLKAECSEEASLWEIIANEVEQHMVIAI